jgi:ubiquitin carboxyl-terminal hydrolase 14
MYQTFDVFEFCGDSLKERLRYNRLRKNQRDEAELALKRQKLTNGSASQHSAEAVASSGEAQLSAMLQTAVGIADVPQPSEASAMLKADDAALERKLDLAVQSLNGADAATLNTSVPLSEHFGEGLPEGFTGNYELMGVVTHKGRSADSGHYIGWVRQSPGSEYWWKYDDDTVTEVNTAEILNLKGGGDWHTAYLNFYRFKE